MRSWVCPSLSPFARLSVSNRRLHSSRVSTKIEIPAMLWPKYIKNVPLEGSFSDRYRWPEGMWFHRQLNCSHFSVMVSEFSEEKRNFWQLPLYKDLAGKLNRTEGRMESRLRQLEVRPRWLVQFILKYTFGSESNNVTDAGWLGWLGGRRWQLWHRCSNGASVRWMIEPEHLNAKPEMDKTRRTRLVFVWRERGGVEHCHEQRKAANAAIQCRLPASLYFF